MLLQMSKSHILVLLFLKVKASKYNRNDKNKTDFPPLICSVFGINKWTVREEETRAGSNFHWRVLSVYICLTEISLF